MNSCKVHSYKFICTSFHYLELVPYDLKQIYSLGGLVFAVTERLADPLGVQEP